MNTHRTTINWASAALSVAFVVVYLVGAFYTSVAGGVLYLSGLNLISLNAIAIIPVVLGVIMAVAACLFPPIAAFIIDALTAIVTLVFMFLGNTIAASIVNVAVGQNLPHELVAALTALVNLKATFHPGWGAVISVGLCIAALVVDILVNRTAKNNYKTYVPDISGQFTPGSGDLFDTGNNDGFNNNNNLF